MNPRTTQRDDALEALVLEFLQREERTVDPDKILAGVVSRTVPNTSQGLRRFGSRPVRTVARWAAGLAAASLLIGFFWTVRQNSAHADAIKLVLEAGDLLEKTAHDRMYRVGFDLMPGMAERSPGLSALATFRCRLWTRSDRFWIEGKRSDQVWACGRDERRHVWVAPIAEVGLDFAPEEISEQFDEGLDLLSLDIKTVLQLMATEFDVTPLGEVTNESSDVTVICGTPRIEHPRPRLRSLTLEIDNRTKIVRQIVFSRTRAGRPIGEVSLTFDQSGNQPDSAYQLSGHLAADALILGPDRRLRRRWELQRFFGSLLTKGK